MYDRTVDAAFLANVRKARVGEGEIALWYTGGAGYVIKTRRATVLIDPFLGPSNPPDWIRALPPAFDPARIGDLGELAAVLLTHEHSDHADPVALGPIGRLTGAGVYGPPACIRIAREADVPVERARVLEHNAAVEIADLRVTAVAMHDPGAPGCNGYVLETRGTTLLHCGDGLYFPGFLEIGRRWALDAICLTVGLNPPGKTFYLDEAGAARATRDAGARLMIPQHFDLWRGITLDPRRIATAARWYCPGTRVAPARFARRMTVRPAVAR